MDDVPTPHRASPRYRRVADELRDRIKAGVIPPGALLPSEAALIAEFGVSRGTVREAISLLRAEGTIVTEHGRGSYARPPMPVRRVCSERYKRRLEQLRSASAEPTSGVDGDVPWTDFQLEKEYQEVKASPEIAELFGVPPGTEVLERRVVFRAYGAPQHMVTSCLLLDMVAGTPLVDPEKAPWPGDTVAQLHSIGVTVTGVRERVRARMPTTNERDILRLTGGIPVITVTRQMYAGERVVEVARDIIIPADRVELEYWIDVS